MNAKIRDPELWGVISGGLMTSLGLFALVVGVGQVGSFEALQLLDAVIPAARFLATAVLTAGITVLALLLTLLGLSFTTDFTFSELFYSRISRITTLSVAMIVVAISVLLAAGLPVAEVETDSVYELFYYAIAGALSLLAGVAVSVSLMIGSTMRDLMRAGRRGRRASHLLELENEETGEDE
ncbi:MAG: hypothetical protein ACLFWH_15690 [Actinomycetota bacterium]